MFIPGDNDIGGEGWDRVTPEKVERFEWAFHAPIEDEEIFKFITFDRANIMPGKSLTLKGGLKSKWPPAILLIDVGDEMC